MLTQRVIRRQSDFLDLASLGLTVLSSWSFDCEAFDAESSSPFKIQSSHFVSILKNKFCGEEARYA